MGIQEGQALETPRGINMKITILLSLVFGVFLAPMSPRLFYKEVREQTKITIVQKPVTDVDIIARSRHPEQLLAIYTLESSQGKNDGCKRSGKFNGFGFRQNSREFKCYDTFEEVVNEVDNWLTEKEYINTEINAVFKYHGQDYKIQLQNDNKILFLNDKPSVAEGQSVVFYDKNVCVGGGIVSYSI
jgi:hypothetical protein